MNGGDFMQMYKLLIPLFVLYLGCNQQKGGENLQIIEKTKNMEIVDRVDDEPDSAITLEGKISDRHITPQTNIRGSNGGNYQFNYVEFQSEKNTYLLAEPYPEPVFREECKITFRPLTPNRISTKKFVEVFLNHKEWVVSTYDTTKITADGIIVNEGIKYK